MINSFHDEDLIEVINIKYYILAHLDTLGMFFVHQTV